MCLHSDAVRPDELFWNSSLGDNTEILEEGSLLEINVQTVGEAMLFLTQKSELVHAEGELDFIGGTLVPAGERSVSDLLGKSE